MQKILHKSQKGGIKNNMKKQNEEKKFRIICIKAPKWMSSFLRKFQKKEEK